MKKRYSKKKRYSRKRKFSKRRRTSAPTPDGAICAKIHAQGDAANNANGESNVCINWAGNAVAAGT